MGEGSARRIDPRFDPRFQRGYAPDAAAAPMLAATDGASTAASPNRDTRRASENVTDAAAADSGDRPGFTALVAPFGDSGDAPSDSGTTRGEGAGSPNRATDDPADAERVEEPEPVPERVDEPESAAERAEEPEPVPERVEEASGDRWFWIAIGACLACIALGSILYWVQASDPWMYTGSARSRDEETMSTFLNALSPALVQAGVVGAVAVLVTWAARGARRAGGRP